MFACFGEGGKSRLLCLEVLVPVHRVQRADERTRTDDLISLRVCGQWLLGCAEACKSRISRRLSALRIAACCTVLRSQWYQSGIKIALPSACTDGDPKDRKHGLPHLCHLYKWASIQEQATVPQNPRIRRSVGTSG